MFRALVFASSLFFASPVSAQVLAQWLVVDTPEPDVHVAQTFSVQGIATGFDFVHIWAFPPSGAVFLGDAFANLPDSERGLLTGRFETTVTAPVGAYAIIVYAHNPATNTFTDSEVVNVKAQKPPAIISGFGSGASLNATAMDDYFTLTMGTTSTSGGSVAFGKKWPTPPSCVASTQSLAENPVIVTATRTAAIINLSASNPGNPTKIQVLCGGGR